MNANPFNRKSLLAGALFALAISANAQVKSTHTDVKYANTTVVYKDTTATDKDVLNTLGDEYGLSDVVRVTVAPPKPAPAPAIDKSRGEDVWLVNPRHPEVTNLTASTATATLLINQVNQPLRTTVTPGATPVRAIPNANPPAVAPRTAPVAVTPKAVAPKAVVAAPVMESNANTAFQDNVAPETVKAHAATGHSVKTAKKASHKSGGGYGKAKSHRAGKRHFACPKF